MPLTANGVGGRKLSLAALSVAPICPVEQVEAAYQAGFQAVGLRLVKVLEHDVDVMNDPALRRRLENTLSELRMEVLDCEVFRIGPSTDLAALRDTVSFASDLGSYCFTITPEAMPLNALDNSQETLSNLRLFGDLVAHHGMRASLEFMKFRGIKSLKHAKDVLERAAHPALGICLDALHHFRSGGTVEEVASMDQSLLCCVQLCDAPLQAPDDIAAEGRFDRLYPGDGELPLRELLRSLSPSIAISVEAPNAQRAAWSAQERAKLLHTKSRELIQAI